MIASRPVPLALTLVPVGVGWRLLLVVAGSALIAVTARIEIPLPFSPVPVTGQTFGVLLVAAALGRLALPSVALYVVVGIAGMPVFSGGASGLARLSGPTGGYLVGFIVASLVVGALAERGWDRRLITAAAAMLAGEVVIYVFGLAWLSRFALPVGLLEAGLTPFIVGDLYKLVLAAAALRATSRVVRRS